MNLIRQKAFANGFVAALLLNDGMKIETTATCLPIETEMRGTGRLDNKVDYNNHADANWSQKYMIGVSTQSGCPIKCKFCAVNKLTEKQGWRNLTSKEIIAQVDWAVEKTGKSPFDAEIFRVLFTRMGEPSINCDAVCEAALYLKRKYPSIRIQISTIGFGKHSARLVRALGEIDKLFDDEWIELQFSIHSTDDNYRKWLQHDKVMSNSAIAGLISTWFGVKEVREWKVTLNFALSTETPFDTVELRKQFNPDTVFIKVSPINENAESNDNGLKTLFTNENTI